MPKELQNKIINYIHTHNLDINEVTTIDVIPEYFLENPDEPDNYINDLGTSIELTLTNSQDKVLAHGTSDDIINYLKKQVED